MWSLDIPRTRLIVSLLLFATVIGHVVVSNEAKSHIKNLLYSQAIAHKNQERLTPHAFDFFIKVHSAEHPVKQAGSWILRPSARRSLSAAHLNCLGEEIQGNCHDPTALKAGSASSSRVGPLNAGSILNSRSILEGEFPGLVWLGASDEYKAITTDKLEVFTEILKSTKFYLMGDSLTRQWAKSLECEMIHYFGLSARDTAEQVTFLWANFGPSNSLHLTSAYNETLGKIDHLPKPKGVRLDDIFANTSGNEYVIWNVGHHMGPTKLKAEWKHKYAETISQALNLTFGRVPTSQTFFRTTTPRHFKPSADYMSKDAKRGSDKHSNEAKWEDFGGLSRSQPMQNIMALEIFANQSGRARVPGIMDIAPMSLARADATFDGAHFCMPGFFEWWTRVLLFKVLRNKCSNGLLVEICDDINMTS
jgi:hypothetical protein